MIDYDYIVDSAMRVLIRDVLVSVAQNGGLPNGNFFHISFITQYDGVSIPIYLLNRYPEEMTIALQNQFRNLTVTDDTFSVDLSFGGQEEHLVIPFCAITSFIDPSQNFMLKMEADKLGMIGKSKFHEMINCNLKKTTKEEVEEAEDNIINFVDIKNLLNQ